MRAIKVKNINGNLMFISDHQKAMVEKNKIIKSLMESLEFFLDDEHCRMDHHGNCQTHSSFEVGNCFMVTARLAFKQAKEASQ